MFHVHDHEFPSMMNWFIQNQRTELYDELSSRYIYAKLKNAFLTLNPGNRNETQSLAGDSKEMTKCVLIYPNLYYYCQFL